MSPHDTIPLPSKAGSRFLLAVGVLLLLLGALVGALLVNPSNSPTETEDAERAAVRTRNLAELRAADNTLLTSYGWNDQAKGIVHLPIARAMELVLPTLDANTATQKQPSEQP